jgi:hypothetical protein
MPLAPEDWNAVQSQHTQKGIRPAIQRLFSECDKSVEQRSATFSVCLTLIEHLSIDQPTALRHAWANKLYKLADTLAATKLPR